MKKFGLILVTLLLFIASIYLAFLQGNSNAASGLTHMAAPAAGNLVYSGFYATMAGVFASILNAFLLVTRGNLFFALILLALFVELILLYPSVRIQLKQKKIHLFHKKLVDRFDRGELSVSETQHELHKLYAVNEKIHSRGALFVTAEVAVLFFVFWGLNLVANMPTLLHGSWDVLSFSLLSTPINFVIPLLTGLLFFLHCLIKIAMKEREDYISGMQSTIALGLAVLGSMVVYWFASLFAVALIIHFVTLIAFETVRFVIVENHARSWGKFAQKELIDMLRHTPIHKNRFEYLSRKWNHIPVVRYINFQLLEEAVSMSLGLLLALNFFGVLQGNDSVHKLMTRMPVVLAADNFPTSTSRGCQSTHDLLLCSNPLYDQHTVVTDSETTHINFTNSSVAGFHLLSATSMSLDEYANLLPPSCCWTWNNQKFQAIRFKKLYTSNYSSLINSNGVGCIIGTNVCLGLSETTCSTVPGCAWSTTTSTCTGALYHNICDYQISDIPDISIANCPAGPLAIGVPSGDITATGGSGYLTWSSTLGTFPADCQGDQATVPPANQCATVKYTATHGGTETITVTDYFNSLNSKTCTFAVTYPAITLTSPPASIATGGTFNVTASGGQGADNYNVTVVPSGAGTVALSGSTITYTAPASATTGVKIHVCNKDGSGTCVDSTAFNVTSAAPAAPQITNCSAVKAGNGLAYGTSAGGASKTNQTFTFTRSGDPAAKWSVTGGGSFTNDTYTIDTANAKPNDAITVKLDNGTSSDTCAFNLNGLPITDITIKEGAIFVGGGQYTLDYTGGPPNHTKVTWVQTQGPGSLTPAGEYTSSTVASDSNAKITVQVTDSIVSGNSKQKELSYSAKTCNSNFGLYYSDQNKAFVQGKKSAANWDVYGGTTYRLKVLNTLLSNAFGSDVTNTLNDKSVVSKIDGEGYIDLVFSNVASDAGTYSISVYDSALQATDSDCKVTLNMTYKGTGVVKKSPTIVNIMPSF